MLTHAMVEIAALTQLPIANKLGTRGPIGEAGEVPTGSAFQLKIDHAPTAKLRAAKRVWRSFHPACAVSGGRITSRDFSFWSTRMIGAGIEVSWSVRAWKVDEASCSLQIRMGLSDERVNALRSIALGFVPSVNFLSFDVLAASSVMDGLEMPEYPLFDSNPQVEEFTHVIGDYSRRIDRIWNFVGGLSVPGFESLAIWALRNSGAGTTDSLYGGICAAFTYREWELAYELIEKLKSQWEERLRLEPRDLVFEVYENVRKDLERLQEAVRRPSGSASA
jgi:hypothetical protein